MLFLLIEIAGSRYALDARQVAEVLPLVNVTRIPEAPAAIVGVINYRGMPVPVVDMSQLTIGRFAERRLSTRLILVHFPDATGRTHLLGLVAERTTRTVHIDESDFVASGLTNDAAGYLGPVAPDPDGLVQWIDVPRILPAPVREMLFRESGTSWCPEPPTSNAS